ncbi:MAG: methyltransferase domain-containing protein [Chloroflexi bacterium]|nr:methyltransferase domain-containing protein [Chloroflexota bacterium]
MSRTNETVFVKQQYATNANLDARIALHQKFSTAAQHFHDWLFDHVHLPENARVLEIGCGSGALWEHVRERVPKDWSITLTDFSYGMAQTVHGKFPNLSDAPSQSPISISIAQCDAQAIPFADETFDGVFANHILYHIPDLQRGLSEIRRVLKRGGALYAATNGLQHMRELIRLTEAITHPPFNAQLPEQLFGLENGASLLAHHFETVQRYVQENNLRVTEVEPLVAYAQSGWLYKAALENPAREQEFRARVQNAIDTRGAFYITKAVGLFVAR